MTKKSNKNLIILLAFVLSAMVVGTIWDYQITDYFYGKFHYFGRFFEIFGEFPAMVGPGVAMAYFFAVHKKENGIISKIFYVLKGILGLLFSFFATTTIARYLNPDSGNSHGTITTVGYIICAAGAILIFVGLVFMFKSMSESTLKAFSKAAWLMIIMFFVTNIGINVIKAIWDRPRYWFLTGYGAETGVEFQPWYIINKMPDILPKGITSNAFKSFPSGHTANAFLMLNLTLFFNPKKNKKAYNFALYFAMIWGFFTCISRLIVGQHFLTDTIIGGLYTVCLFFLLKKILKIDKEKF